MAANTDPIFPLTPKTPAVSFIDSDGTTPKTLFAASTDGSILVRLSGTSSDTSDVDIVITVNDGSSDFIIGEITVPIGSGTGTVSPTNLFDPSIIVLQNDGTYPLQAGHSILVNPKVAVTATFQVDIVGIAGDYIVL